MGIFGVLLVYLFLFIKEGGRMNVKKWIIASVVILVVDQALGWLIHGVMLSDMYKATSELWRSTAEMTSMMWMMIVTSLRSIRCLLT